MDEAVLRSWNWPIAERRDVPDADLHAYECALSCGGKFLVFLLVSSDSLRVCKLIAVLLNFEVVRSIQLLSWRTSLSKFVFIRFHFGFILRAAASIWGSIPPWPSAGNETERGSRRKRKKQGRLAKNKQHRKKIGTRSNSARVGTRATPSECMQPVRLLSMQACKLYLVFEFSERNQFLCVNFQCWIFQVLNFSGVELFLY